MHYSLNSFGTFELYCKICCYHSQFQLLYIKICYRFYEECGRTSIFLDVCSHGDLMGCSADFGNERPTFCFTRNGKPVCWSYFRLQNTQLNAIDTDVMKQNIFIAPFVKNHSEALKLCAVYSCCIICEMHLLIVMCRKWLFSIQL